MKIHRDLLLSALHVPSAAISPGHDSLAAHVCVRSRPDSISFLGSNSSAMAAQVIKIENDLTDFCTREKPLADLLSGMPSSDIDISVQFPHLLLKCGKSSYKLPVQDAGSFAPLPASPPVSLKISSLEIKLALNCCLWNVVGNQQTINFQGALMMVEAPGDIKWYGVATPMGSVFHFTVEGIEDRAHCISKNTAMALSEALPAEQDIEIGYAPTFMSFSWGNAVFIAPLVDVDLPPLEKLYRPHESHFEIGRDDFISALKRISSVISTKSDAPATVKLCFYGDSLLMTGTDEGQSDAQEEIASRLVDGNPQENIKYDLGIMMTALRKITGGTTASPIC